MSAWGASWGSAFGAAFGSIAPAVQADTPIFSAGGGGAAAGAPAGGNSNAFNLDQQNQAAIGWLMTHISNGAFDL